MRGTNVTDTPIPLVDLRAAWAEIADEVEPLILERLRSGDYLGVETIAAFEREFAAYVGGGVEAVACSSGTDAVELMVRCCTDDDALVDVESQTFVATVAGVERAGRRVLRDAVWSLRPGVTPECLPDEMPTAAIKTHLYGDTNTYGVSHWKEHGVTILEDASQAHGNRRAGTIGVAAAWSCYPSKNLGAAGQAGICTFRDSVAAARARRIREHGYERKHDEHFGRGFNMRMDAVQADILRVKLRRLDGWVARRREIAKTYNTALKSLVSTYGPLLTPDGDDDHAWHVYSLRIVNGRRDQYLAGLRERGVMAAVHYRRDAFGRDAGWCNEALSLPMYPQMTDSQVQRVIDTVREVVG